ncbi:MAG: hypothetical protein HFJ48_01340 [Clostridia bacterium]|nr:hypothetical protein [Clostridia bacterium]
MKVIVFFDNKVRYDNEFEYYSKYSRINAVGIFQEAKEKMIEKFGKHAENYEIIDISRV